MPIGDFYELFTNFNLALCLNHRKGAIMPNWCNNTLRISGDKEVISRIRDWYEKYQSNKTELGLFGTFYPLPEELKDTTAPSSEPNWYDWQTTEWGTKWDTGEVCLVVETENEIRLLFDTAWAPPIAFYEKLSEDYPKLHIRASYYEPGCDFCGTFDSDCGEETLVISDIERDCLKIYKNKYKDYVDDFEFKERLENIYISAFPISKDVDVCNIFDGYFFDEKLEDKRFCKEYKIKPQKENQ